MSFKLSIESVGELLKVFKSYQTGSNVMDVAGLTCYIASSMFGVLKGHQYDEFKQKIYDVSYVYAHLDGMFDSCDDTFKKALYHSCIRIIRTMSSDAAIDKIIDKNFDPDLLHSNGVDISILRRILRIGRDRSCKDLEKTLLTSLMECEVETVPSLEHACLKGGITMMFVNYTISGEEEYLSSNYMLGAMIQLDDDLRDIKLDDADGTETYVRSINNVEDFDNYVISGLYIMMKLHEEFEELIVILAWGFIDAAIRSDRCSSGLVDVLKRWYYMSDDFNLYQIVIEHCHNIADIVLNNLENDTAIVADDGGCDF